MCEVVDSVSFGVGFEVDSKVGSRISSEEGS